MANKIKNNAGTVNNLGLQTTANPNRELTVNYADQTYYRYPVRTHLVQLGEDYIKVIEKYVEPELQEGDLLVCSEKFIGICQERVVHESEIETSWLAKLIAKFVVKYPDDVGWENPKKVQVAIEQVGWLRSIWAVMFGGIMKFLFKKPGWYYRIMGRDVAAIDGFNPLAIPPFNEYAMLAPAEPHKTASKIAKHTNAPTIIVDASNVAIHVLGRSEDVEQSDDEIAEILDGNPMGQSREQTPMLIVRHN